MSVTTEIVINGRNNAGNAFREAEDQLRGLNRQGRLLGDVFRGTAFLAAAFAFERLAENAQKAAEAIGDTGTARSLKSLNKAIDDLKLKGTNVIGKVLGNLYATATGDALGKLNEQVEFLKNNLASGFVSLAYGRIGTGIFSPTQTLAKLTELEKIQKMYQDNLPYGQRENAPGSHGRGQAINIGYQPPAGRAPAEPGLSDIYIRSYLKHITTLPMAQEEAFKQMDADAKHFSLEFSADLGNGYADTARELEQLTKETESATSEWTVYADQAARNMQDAFAQFLFDPFHEGLQGMLKGFIDVIRQMVAQMAAVEIFDYIGGALKGSSIGWVSSIGSSLMHKAAGGPVSGGTPYLVGERGPEMFIPGTSGTIIPNGAGGVTINQSFDVRGADAERIMAIMPGLLKQSKLETIAAIRDLNSRGRL